jgi:hypothetical protein
MMDQLKNDMQAVAKDLKRLTQKTEKMIKHLEKLEKVEAAKKPRAKKVEKPVAKKAKKVTSADTVLAIIKGSRKGIDKATLRKKTGFEGRQIGDIIYKLKKQGKIKSLGKGTYIKA